MECENGDTKRGDKEEQGRVSTVNGKLIYDRACNPGYISCCSSNLDTNCMFSLFDNSFAIIESTVGELKEIINTEIKPYIHGNERLTIIEGISIDGKVMLLSRSNDCIA